MYKSSIRVLKIMSMLKIEKKVAYFVIIDCYHLKKKHMQQNDKQ